MAGLGYCGHSSVVERNLAKVDVARSNRVARLVILGLLSRTTCQAE